jgi:hypothetical protein
LFAFAGIGAALLQHRNSGRVLILLRHPLSLLLVDLCDFGSLVTLG